MAVFDSNYFINHGVTLSNAVTKESNEGAVTETEKIASKTASSKESVVTTTSEPTSDNSVTEGSVVEGNSSEPTTENSDETFTTTKKTKNKKSSEIE